MSDTSEVLKRLLRRIGREAGRYERWAAEANVLRMAQGFIREEMRKVKKP
jgi:hypothetical protein